MAGYVAEELRFVWLEITGRCQLACEHCYAGSGPTGTHGRMTTEDWLRVVDEAAGLGVPMVQFIGGEPTLHPDLPVFVERALAHGVEVEVFTNLVHVTSAFWELFARPGVRLATSWYSDDADEHEAVTTRRGVIGGPWLGSPRRCAEVSRFEQGSSGCVTGSGSSRHGSCSPF